MMMVVSILNFFFRFFSFVLFGAILFLSFVVGVQEGECDKPGVAIGFVGGTEEAVGELRVVGDGPSHAALVGLVVDNGRLFFFFLPG